jgi:hypothetical protein
MTTHRFAARVVLFGLGGIQFVNGLWITISPTSFYEDFPLGRGWVEALPAYNEHLMRDVGGLFMGTGFLLLVAGALLERRLILISLVTWLLFAVPHTVYHLLNLEPYGTGDAIGNAVALAATVLLPLWLLVVVGRDDGSTPVPPPAP